MFHLNKLMNDVQEKLVVVMMLFTSIAHTTRKVFETSAAQSV